MDNFILVSDGRPLAAVEKQFARYLPGLDARLFPFTANQAIVPAALLRALAIEYPSVPPAQMLAVLGAAELKPIGAEASAMILAGRDAVDVPARPGLAAQARDARSAAAAARFDWHLENTFVPQAWQRLGGPDAIDWGATRAGHIDTGYTRHPALGFGPASAGTWLDTAQARTFMPPAPGADEQWRTPEPGGGQDPGSGVSGGHGTRIGATISGRDAAAAGSPFYGVAPRLPVVPVRITDIVWINHAQREFAQAVAHLIGQRVGVINISLGVFAGGMVRELRRAVNDAYDAGVILCCAAGNYVNSVVGPASLARTIAVGGVTRADQPWSGSSYGPEVDFSAPAADLRRANVKGSDRYSYAFGGDGTSYATAITTGAAALWLTHRRAEIAAAYAQPWQRIEAFRLLARQTARVPASWRPGAFGAGVLNVDELLDAALPAAADLQAAPAA